MDLETASQRVLNGVNAALTEAGLEPLGVDAEVGLMAWCRSPGRAKRMVESPGLIDHLPFAELAMFMQTFMDDHPDATEGAALETGIKSITAEREASASGPTKLCGG